MLSNEDLGEPKNDVVFKTDLTQFGGSFGNTAGRTENFRESGDR